MQELDYFRRVKKIFQCAERGAKADERRILRELAKKSKKHMYNKESPKFILNTKNFFGQTPLYVAAKNGNLNIVKLLIEEGCNPFIKSATDLNSEESNL